MGKFQMSKGEPIKPSTTHFVFFPNHLIMPEIGWSSYCMRKGRVWAGNSNLGKTHFLGKNIFEFWCNLTLKMHSHLAIHPCSPFSSHSGSLVFFLPTRFFLWYVLLHDLGSWVFSSSSFTHVGALSSGWEFSVCEIRFWVALCVCVFFPHLGSHFFILLSRGFIFVIICGWFSSVMFLLHFPHWFQS